MIYQQHSAAETDCSTLAMAVPDVPALLSFCFFSAAVAAIHLEMIVVQDATASGSSFFSAAAAVTATTTAVETAVSGLSFCYSAVADLEADPTTVVAVAMDSEMAAANLSQKIPAGLTRPEFYFI